LDTKNLKLFDLLNTPLSGTCLIEASAGTGKTYTIASLIIRLILRQPLTIDQILVVTFTNAAAQELKERIRSRLLETRTAFSAGFCNDPFINSLLESSENKKHDILKIEDALINFDRAAIFTIHGFCQKILAENAFETGSLFDTELITDQRSFVQVTADDFWRKEFYDCCSEFAEYGIKKIKNPEYFTDLLRKACNFRVKVIPETKRPEPGSLGVFKKYRQNLQSMWPEVRDEIIDLLKYPGFKANIYGSLKPGKQQTGLSARDLKIISMRDAMDRFTAEGNSGLSVFKEFENFTASKIKKSVKKGSDPLSHKFFDLCDLLYDLGTKLQSEMDSLLLFLKTEFFRYANTEIEKRKQKGNIRFFDDLLNIVHNALHQDRGESFALEIRKKYKVALVDEFQDTDPLQYEIFTKLFGEKKNLLCMIGDPKQAIYSFRGADIFSYIKAARDARQKNTLIKNWRSCPGLIKAVNTIFGNALFPFVFEEIPFFPGIPGKNDCAEKQNSAPPFTLWYLDPEKSSLSAPNKPISKSDAVREIANSAASEIVDMINPQRGSKTKQVKPGDIAVLARTNHEAQIITNCLCERRVPCVLYSEASVFHTKEAQELETILTGILRPGDQRAFRAALATDIMGVKAEAFDFSDQAPLWWGAAIEQFHEYLRIWQTSGFFTMFCNFMIEQKIKKKALSFSDGERRLTNILHLSELLDHADTEKNLGTYRLVKWLCAQRNTDFVQHEAHQLRLESDKDGVKIITIHKSKGLEYEIVFCPFAWSGSVVSGEHALFHSSDKDIRTVLDLGSEDFKAHSILAANELLAENLRLLYVAVTRATRKCYLVWGRINTAETSAIAYLFHGAGLIDPPDKSSDKSSGKQVRNITNKLKKIISEKKDHDLFADLERLAEKSEGTIRLKHMPQPTSIIYEPLEKRKTELSCETFSRSIDRSWKISSYSSLISNQSVHIELPDYDADYSPVQNREKLHQDQNDIFSFPKGAGPGIFFHDVFEHLDFTCEESEYRPELIKEKLVSYGLDPVWKDAVLQMVNNVISAPLNKGKNPVFLQTVKKERRINELEFYFPLKNISTETLTKTFRHYSLTRDFDLLGQTIESLSFQPAHGFMKGFIDMVFWAENKYYLVDWKSNHLGNQARDYSQDALTKTMKQSHYILQYYLYTLALDMYLQTRNPDYDYKNNFGGVFYIFIRGVDPKLGPDFGIYNDLPDPAVVHALGKCLIPEGERL
jgi:exodeoxyribonuclease V beta subunit